MPLCEFLEWDSNFFGVRIGRVLGHRLSLETAPEVLVWCRDHEIDCLFFLADQEPESIRAAEGLGFHLTDLRLTLEAQLNEPKRGGATTLPQVATVRGAALEDIPALRRIAASSHTDSRFYQDGGFPRDRCDELFRIWIEKSCRGAADAVLVAERDAQAAGYITCEVAGDRGRIGLVAVAEDARGTGLGHALLSHALYWMFSRAVKVVSVVTQGRNLRAQRLYQAHGFANASLQLWYHLWPSTPNR
jgi:dTDP-4-amino-4,6-dideoxy-D-galactose acyltransferase